MKMADHCAEYHHQHEGYAGRYSQAYNYGSMTSNPA